MANSSTSYSPERFGFDAAPFSDQVPKARASEYVRPIKSRLSAVPPVYIHTLSNFLRFSA